jgi:hypothetical protein
MRRIVLLFALLCIAGLPVLVYAGPKAQLDKEIIDLGQLKEGKLYEFSFPLYNRGDSELIISSVYAPCGCLKVISPKAKTPVAPGASLDIKYNLDSTGLSEQVTKYMYIYTNEPANSPLKIAIGAQVERSKEAMVKRFSSFSTATIVTAGLIDGINPCAFTVLVFFISFLAFAGYKRQQIIILGSFFILAVFITYILIGIGLFEFFRRLEVFYLISHIVYIGTAVLAIVLGVISLYDYWIFKKTNDPEKIKLKLPALVKQQIHQVIRDTTGTRERPDLKSAPNLRLAIAALSSGFIVSILESICTGQVYLPTIVYVLGFSKMQAQALGYLLLYNFMFIFVVGLLGMTSEGFTQMARRHMAKVKLITSAVFFGLGIGLLLIVKK